MSSGITGSRIALIVHPEVAFLSQYQSVLAKNEILPVVARDLPTALLAMTQHQFAFGVFAADIAEPGDGWPLAGVFRLAFPDSTVGVLTSENDMHTYMKAINLGVQRLILPAMNVDGVVTELALDLGAESQS